jgi:hypothetical protein
VNLKTRSTACPSTGSTPGRICAILGLLALSCAGAPSPAPRQIPLAPCGTGPPGFALLPPERTGVTFTNRITDQASAANRVLENGSGIAIGDINGDERPDLFLCSLAGESALYKNLGDWRFTNVTAESGLAIAGEVCRGAVFADLNGDRLPDLLVSTLARGVLCHLNASGGRFINATASAGIPICPGATTLALADVDANGTLDLYVACYRAEDIRDDANVQIATVKGRSVLHPRFEGRLFLSPLGLLEYGEPDLLLLNDGAARFRKVSWTGGAFRNERGEPLAGAPRDWGLSAAFHDLNADSHPDLYVCNDYWTPDRLWMNRGDGTFDAAPREAIRHTSENSMGVDFADLDHDGDVDFLVLDMLSRDLARRRRQAIAQTPIPTRPGEILNRPQVMRNTLQLNRGDGTFAEIACYAQLTASDWSWQPLFLDVDLDGREDVIVPAGHRRDVQDLDATTRIQKLQHPWAPTIPPDDRQREFTRERKEHSLLYPAFQSPLIAFRNVARLRFDETGMAWGFDSPAVHQAIASGDLDQDGDLDLVVATLNSNVRIYQNTGGGGRIAVRLRGRPPNTAGIGARVILQGGPTSTQSREIMAGGRYLSGCEPILAFATGDSGGPLTLRIQWRSGAQSTFTGVRPGHLCEIEEPDRSDPP